MKSYPGNLKAFTLMELLIAMAVMALVASLSLSGLNLLQSQYRQFNNIHDKMWEVEQFTLSLQHEASSAQSMEVAPSELVFAHPEGLQVSYRFEESHVIKQARQAQPLAQDTFSLPGQVVRASFEGASQASGIVDYCQVSFVLFEEEQQVHLYKHYSTYELLKTAQQ